jgi:excisionase family DNA binding protein
MPKMTPAAAVAYHEINEAINQMAAFVELVEANPNPVNFPELAEVITGLSMKAQLRNANFSRYGLFFDPEPIDDVVRNFDDTIELLADRFFQACGPTDDGRIAVTPMELPQPVEVLALPPAQRESITTRDAMERFGKSRSTIYRWIKSGKLSAEKQGRNWIIFI